MTTRSTRRSALRTARRSALGLPSRSSNTSDAPARPIDAGSRILTEAAGISGNEASRLSQMQMQTLRTTQDLSERDELGAEQVKGASLKARGLSYVYHDRPAVLDVDLDLDAGQLLVLLGPNGAGKSTLFKMLAGQLRPQTGEVLLCGKSTRTGTAVRRALGFVPQSIALYPKLSVIENLQTFGALMGLTRQVLRERIRDVLEVIDLEDRRHDRVENLSGGMQRRVNIGAALIHQPAVLLLDEPTAGVDRESRLRLAELFATLRGAGLSVLLTTHDLDEAQMLADRVAIMIGGSIRAYGSATSLIEQVFGQRREIQIELYSDTAHSSSSMKAVRKALPNEFSILDGDVLSAIRELKPGDLDQLLTQCRNAGATVQEIRVRRPGLAQLLSHYINADSVPVVPTTKVTSTKNRSLSPGKTQAMADTAQSPPTPAALAGDGR